MFHVEHVRRKTSNKCFTWNAVTSLTIFNKEISKKHLQVSEITRTFAFSNLIIAIMNKININHYLLVTDVINNDGENALRFSYLLWWNVNHCDVTLKLRTVINNGKPMTIMTLVTPDDRPDLLNEFDELVNKVNGLYPVFDLLTVCGGLSSKDIEEDKAYHTQY